ncbi:MAG: SAF domain-containing protein, partial [Pantoea sp.]|nr:SAF domain-containing protein [Pantoea sp.]
MQDAIKIHSQDNVAVALRDLDAGQTIDLQQTAVQLQQAVTRGHKFA